VVDSTAFIGVIGKGDGPGLEAHVLPYPVRGDFAPAERGGLGSTGAVHRVPPDLQGAIGKRWSSVPETYHPPAEPDGFTVKISRHRDSWGGEWLWVGLYQSVSFLGDTRGGSYFGAGLALSEVPSSALLYNAVERLFSVVRRDLFVGLQMAKPVFSFAPHAQDLPRLEGCEPLASDRGLDPASDRGKLVELDNVFHPTVSRQLQAAIQSDAWRGYSTLYLANWRDPQVKEDFFVLPDSVSAASPSGGHEPAGDYPKKTAEDIVRRYDTSHSSVPDFSLEAASVDEFPAAGQSFEERLWRQLDRIEKQGKVLERHLERLVNPQQPSPEPTKPPRMAREWEFDAAHWLKIVLIAGIVLLVVYTIYLVATSVSQTLHDASLDGAASMGRLR
jgi:hypothetical protein